MKSIWVVLLDTSSSMEEGFSGERSHDVFAEVGRWRTKLDAAKEILLRQVRGAQAQEVALFAFSTLARKVFHGGKQAFLGRTADIATLVAKGDTNLAHAFELVKQDPTLHGYDSISILVLTDGLANVDDPVRAARELVAEYPGTRIDTVLIDETPEGRAQAEAFSIYGLVRPAFSTDDLAYIVSGQRRAMLQSELATVDDQRWDLRRQLGALAGTGEVQRLRERSGLALSAQVLRDRVVPYVEAIEVLSAIHHELNPLTPTGRVSAISQDSPLQVVVEGLVEIIRVLIGLVTPWMRDHTVRMQQLKEEQRALENEERRLVLAEHKLELENRRLAQDLFRRRQTLEFEKLEIDHAKLLLAEGIISHMSSEHEIPKATARVLENAGAKGY